MCVLVPLLLGEAGTDGGAGQFGRTSSRSPVFHRSAAGFRGSLLAVASPWPSRSSATADVSDEFPVSCSTATDLVGSVTSHITGGPLAVASVRPSGLNARSAGLTAATTPRAWAVRDRRRPPTSRSARRAAVAATASTFPWKASASAARTSRRSASRSSLPRSAMFQSATGQRRPRRSGHRGHPCPVSSSAPTRRAAFPAVTPRGVVQARRGEPPDLAHPGGHFIPRRPLQQPLRPVR